MNNNFSNGMQLALDGDEAETISLAGFEVAKAELFAHTREPAVTIWDNKIKFNMACLRRFPGIKYIQLLIHPPRKATHRSTVSPRRPRLLAMGNGWFGGGNKE